MTLGGSVSMIGLELLVDGTVPIVVKLGSPSLKEVDRRGKRTKEHNYFIVTIRPHKLN